MVVVLRKPCCRDSRHGNCCLREVLEFKKLSAPQGLRTGIYLPSYGSRPHQLKFGRLDNCCAKFSSEGRSSSGFCPDTALSQALHPTASLVSRTDLSRTTLRTPSLTCIGLMRRQCAELLGQKRPQRQLEVPERSKLLVPKRTC